jgi:membrane protein required for beta-lactamase induction
VSAAYPVVWRSVFLAIKWVGELLFYVLTLLYVALVALIFYGGGQAEIERQVDAAIEQENQTTCGTLDGLGTRHYCNCTAALTDVRDQDHARAVAVELP